MTAFPLTRRKFLKAAAASIAAAGAVTVGSDAIFREPNHPRLERVEVLLQKLPARLDGFTIAQLSDFHYDPHFTATPIEAAVNVVNGLNADLAVLCGDYVTAPLLGARRGWLRAAEAADPCARLLGRLRTRLGVVAVLGNHDAFTDPGHVTRALEVEGIRVLRNQSIPIEHNGASFWLAGVNAVLGGGANIHEALRGVPGSKAVVLLCHEPDFADQVARFGVDLQLSGHSHGGQVRLPLVGPLYLPPLARKYPWGLRRIGPMLLYTNCGIGTIRIPVRWNCPPEITVFTLRSPAVSYRS